MSEFLGVLRWITINIFGEASILIGLIVLLGLVLQKKSLADIVSGTLKGILGFLIIGAGAGIIVSALLIFQPIWTEVFGLSSMNLTNIIGQARFSERYGSSVTIAIAGGFAINLLLARLTRFKYIYLTGHMMFWTTMIFAGVVVNTEPAISALQLTLMLTVIMGLYWTLQPALVQPWVRKITGNDNVALGHTSASVALLGAIFGQIFARNKISSEDIKVPKKLGFLRDSNVVTALTMALLFFIGTFILQIKGTPKAAEILAQSGDLSFYIYALKQSLMFTGGIAVVLLGVRMFIGEMLLWLTLIGRYTGYVFIPSMIVIFFHAGTAGVFGNITGGYKGALLAGFITSTVVAWGQYFCVTGFINNTIPDTALWAGDSDMFVLAPLIHLLTRLLTF